jgi:hypothetical protein
VTHVNPLIPPRLEALIETALEKDRDLRHQHASDFEAELKRIRRDLESGSLVAASSRTTIIPPAERKSATTAGTKPAQSRWWIWLAAGSLVILALTVAGYNLWSDTASQVAVTDTAATATPPRAETTVPEPAPAPDRSGGASPPATDPALPPLVPRPQDAASATRPTPQPQPQQPARPTTEPRPQATQPPVTPTPQRTPTDAPTPGAGTVPAPSPNATLPPPPQTTEAPSATPAPTSTPAQPQPGPPAAEPPAAQPPPKTAATAPPAQPTIPPSSPVESDDALIRGVVRTYERAIETKNVDLYRSVRPGLSAAEESRLRASFSQIDSQQVDIVVEELRVDGRTATVRLSRRDTFMSGGRRQTNASRQTLRFEKAAAGWIITDIR